MSLKLRLLIYTNALLLITLVIGLAVIMLVSQKNVREEIISTQSLAVFAIENGIKKNPEFYLFEKNNGTFGLSDLANIRHLQIQFIDLKGQIVDKTKINLDDMSQPPEWFKAILGGLSEKIPAQKIDILQRGKIIGHILIKPEPIYEFSEIWQQIIVGLWMMITFFGFLNLIIFILFSYMIKPISHIIQGFERLEGGNYRARVDKSNILELNVIGNKFNSMVKKLKANNQKIHKLSQDLINVQEQEKKDLAQNLHDELGQVLTAIQAEAASIPTTTNKNSRNQAAQSIINLSKNMMLSTRTIIKKLSLGLLEELGFQPAIDDLIKSWHKRFAHIKLRCDIDEEALKYITTDRQPHVYRIVQEALTNITKHSNAKNVFIKIFYMAKKKMIKIEISNDGARNVKQDNNGIGLLGIAERVSQMNGKLHIKYGKTFKLDIEMGLGHG